MLALGLMSGTSMDAVDAALCEFEDGRWQGLLATHTQTYPTSLRSRLLAVQAQPQAAIPLREWMQLDEAVAGCFSDAACGLLKLHGIHADQVQVLGAHGQTVFHDPQGIGSSLQLGNPSRIAIDTGIATVADFRRADIVLGGEGAPLVPGFHHALFAHAEEPRCVLNLGGIANLTVLPNSQAGQVRGFDIGPGNALLDEWCALHTGKPFDENGGWGATGKIDIGLLDALLEDPYFDRPSPKSTGRDHFNLTWLQQRYPAVGHLRQVDVQCSLAAVTVASIVAAIERDAPDTQRLLVCGGGVRNGALMGALCERLAPIRVESTLAHGLDERWVEAGAFAWLAVQRMLQQPGNLPAVTGARRAARLGGLYLP